MKVEEIEFHGGPRNGEHMAIPGGGHDDIKLKVFMHDPKTREPGFREGHYTRVHKINENPTSQFEWSGFITAFTPLPQETSA